MSQFSTTRIADHSGAVSSNAYLAPAIAWLRANTAMNRLSDLEIYEALSLATTKGGFAFSQNSHSIP
ncbi:hypothetical protein [Bradyrhizobium ivorense]|uniref:hypothetical protein n=1 Tax=Bradyrhizobium ivorense TaxID=2511166 RepID=UPI0010BC0508|nr:hypothetical protein [Bradyrhizobium ivorense]VIO73894.1 hypothetical protein CI41S_40030 [Bradyrhizobium ivorense]